MTEEEDISTSHYLSWIIFARFSSNNNNHLKVITYINIKLISFKFLLRKDIFSHCNINLVSFINHGICHMQVHLSENNIPIVKSPSNHTSLPSTVATFLATHLMAVLQPSGYSVFHSGDTPIQLSLPWQSYSCQCLNTKTSAWGNRGFTTGTLSIS